MTWPPSAKTCPPSLTRTLTQVKDLVPDCCNFADSDLTNNTQRDIHEIVSSCFAVASDIYDILSGHEGKLVALSWATRGKRKVATSKVLLETNRRAPSLAVDTITLSVIIVIYPVLKTDSLQSYRPEHPQRYFHHQIPKGWSRSCTPP